MLKKVKRYTFHIVIFSSLIICNNVFAEQCYVLVEKAGNFNSKIVQSLSVSLISKYITKVVAVPNAGIREKDCAYNVSLMESIDGFQYSLSSPNINSMGNSKKSGMDGLTQSLLRALSRSSDGSELKNRICIDYPELMAQDCRPIEAMVMLYNEQGENIPNGASVREGEAFFVMLQPMADSHAVVFNKDSKGNFFRIFPNPQVSTQTNPLRSQQQYFFPPQNSELIFKFDENPGEESFYFVISSTPLGDIDTVYDSIESGARGLTSILEQRIKKRGMTIGKKIHPVVGKGSNMPITGELLTGKGAIVKMVKLRHVR